MYNYSGFIIISYNKGVVLLSAQSRYHDRFTASFCPSQKQGSIRPDALFSDDVEYGYDLGETTDFIGFFRSMREGRCPPRRPARRSIMWTFAAIRSNPAGHIAPVVLPSLSAYDYLSTAAVTSRGLQRRIETFDTLSISGSMALLVYARSYCAIRAPRWTGHRLAAREHAPSSYFTVNDLNHLRRGGRYRPRPPRSERC